MDKVDEVFPATITFSDGTPLERRYVSQAHDMLFVDYVGEGPDRLRSAHFYVNLARGWGVWTPEHLAEQVRVAEEFDRRSLAYMQKAGK